MDTAMRVEAHAARPTSHHYSHDQMSATPDRVLFDAPPESALLAQERVMNAAIGIWTISV